MKTFTSVSLRSLPAFTLVELIVVITIVWILSTVGFISYSGYLTGARDSNRYSQMTKLSDSLQVYAATKSLPLPDNYVEITNSGSVIAYQGYVWSDVLETIDYTNGGLDPKDDSYFTYMLSRDRKALQLLAFMEESVAYTPLSTQSYAADYSNRYPVTYGQKLWVLTDIDNSPIQELTLPGNILDISTTTLTLKSFLLGSEFVVDNLATLPQLQNIIPQKGKFWTVVDNTFVFNSPFRYPWCDTDDIIIWSFTIAACNIGSSLAWTTIASVWNYFQWWRNKGFAYGETSQQPTQIAWSIWLNAATDTFWFVWNDSPQIYQWATTDITNNWWDTTNTNIDRQWPCAPWYHVPSYEDWEGIVTAGGWGNNGASIQSALQLPNTWYRSWYDGSWNYSNSNGFYWSSASYDEYYSYYFFVNNSNQSDGSLMDSIPVRCFKN